MLNSLFSVITPTYNCEEFILRSYKSLLSQSEKSWEWILIDDGSKDNTKGIVETINDERINFYSYKINKGRGYARKFGLSKAKGEIIVIWDIDDIYLSNRLDVIKNKICDYDFFVSQALIVDNNLNLKGIRSFSKNELFTGFVHSSLAFKSEIKNEINYDETMTVGEDLESMIFLTNNCRGFYYNEPLMLYVEDREVNLNKTLLSNRSRMITIKKAYALKISKIKKYQYYKIITLLSFKIFILRSFKLYPRFYLLTVKLRSIDNSIIYNIHYLDLIKKIKIDYRFIS